MADGKIVFGDWQGLNRKDPVHTLMPGELRKAQNVIARSRVLETPPGTDDHMTNLPNRVTWTERFYGIRADGTRFQKTLAFSNGSIYRRKGDGTAEEVQSGFDVDARPESVVVRQAGNNILMFFTGDDRPYEYDGNDGDTWNLSDISYEFEAGIWWLDRLWAFTPNSTSLYFSKTRYPSNFTDSTDSSYIPVAAAKGGYIVAIALLGDVLYVFKNNGIYYIQGRTKATFSVRSVFDDRGLATKRGMIKVGSAFVLLCEQDKEWYEFTGTETGWRKISKNLKFSKYLNQNKVDMVSAVWHDNLFRASYCDTRDHQDYPEREVVFPTDEMRADGQPKWTELKGSNVDSYAVMDQHTDNGELITGRSDTGKVMVHGADHGRNWDTTAMEKWIRTKDEAEYIGWNSEYRDINLSGGVDRGTIEMRYYLDARDSGFDTKTIDQSGITAAGGGIGGIIPVVDQVRWNDHKVARLGYNIGETFGLEFYNNDTDKGFKLYEAVVEARVLHRKRNHDVVGG